MTVRQCTAAIREVTFSTRTLTIHVEVTSTVLHGTVVPPQRGRLEVRSAGRAPQVVDIDEQGWFSAPVPRRWFHLLCRTELGDDVLTDRLTV